MTSRVNEHIGSMKVPVEKTIPTPDSCRFHNFAGNSNVGRPQDGGLLISQDKAPNVPNQYIFWLCPFEARIKALPENFKGR